MMPCRLTGRAVKHMLYPPGRMARGIFYVYRMKLQIEMFCCYLFHKEE